MERQNSENESPRRGFGRLFLANLLETVRVRYDFFGALCNITKENRKILD